MKAVVFGAGNGLPAPLADAQVLPPADVAALATLGSQTELVLLEDPAAPGFLARLAEIRLALHGSGAVLAAWSASPSVRERFICHNAGLSLLQPRNVASPEALAQSLEAARNSAPAGRIRPSFDLPVHAQGLYQALERASIRRQDENAVFVHLFHGYCLLADPDILVFMLHGQPESVAKILSGPGVDRDDWNYFSRFCQQDFLETNRYVDIAAMRVDFLEHDRRQIRKSAPRPICSYWHQALADSAGRTIGTVHIGSFRNRYFTPDIEARLADFSALAGPLVGNAREYRHLDRRHGDLRRLFAKFLPEPIIEKLLADSRAGQADSGSRREMAVLFSDVRGFTTITERNGAEGVVQFLNRHFDAMVQPIRAAGGTVDKFIGDAIVAVFDDPAMAVQAAIGMIAALPTVPLEGLAVEGGRYRIGIGLHWGELVLGYLGSDEKIAYTVVGDTIGIAEELESATKEFGVEILASEALRHQVDDPRFVFRALGRLHDAGGAAAPAVFAVNHGGALS